MRRRDFITLLDWRSARAAAREGFRMSIGVGEHIFRAVVVYVFLFLLLRFVGKKHVGELAPFDLLVLLILSETVQNAMISLRC
jgi:hypothetical protein